MKLVTIAIAVLFGFAAQAEDQSVGCGLGYKVAPENTLISTTTRASTNAYTQPFGVTTGTSGCAKHTIVKKDKEPVYFAEANFDNLSIEMAHGEGQYLTGFAHALSCQDGSVDAFAQFTKANYEQIFNNAHGPHDMLNNLQTVLKNKGQALNCNTNII